jgi:hypothetical protein
VDASPTPVLTWLPGRAAVGHHVYFSDRRADVQDGTPASDKGQLEAATFAPGPLATATTYYWRVDEILATGGVKAGPVWSFTTYLPIEDFESYTDDEGSRIYQTWIDGYTNDTSGSTVGHIDAPFAERTVVHGGLQSMPLEYNNVNSPFYSEADREFATAQDWTAGEVTTLVLFVRGKPGNGAAPLYLVLTDASNRTGTVTYPDAAVVGTAKWIEWKVPLSRFADADMAKIKKISIGLGDKAHPAAGGTGMIFVDDIRLIKP